MEASDFSLPEDSSLSVIDPGFMALKYLSENLREADLEEMTAAVGEVSSVLDFLISSIDESEVSVIVAWDGIPMVLIGCCSNGMFWALGTDDISIVPSLDFYRCSSAIIEGFHLDYEVLWNAVLAKNTVHVDWLRAMGFTVKGDIAAGPNKEHFLGFRKERDASHV